MRTKYKVKVIGRMIGRGIGGLTAVVHTQNMFGKK